MEGFGDLDYDDAFSMGLNPCVRDEYLWKVYNDKEKSAFENAYINEKLMDDEVKGEDPFLIPHHASNFEYQCIVYLDNYPNANMPPIEYIGSERHYETIGCVKAKYGHPWPDMVHKASLDDIRLLEGIKQSVMSETSAQLFKVANLLLALRNSNILKR